MNIIEIEGPNLPRDLKPFRDDERFCAYEPGGHVSEAMPFSDAMRQAAGMGGDARVGFVPEDYQPPAPARRAVRRAT